MNIDRHSLQTWIESNYIHSGLLFLIPDKNYKIQKGAQQV